ncbi:MAG: outer membrane protein assembly factor BamB [Gammaproteobacteria bacterium]|nr:MAG: outer membrane protein assembly factor BamB [Gammaproteobacteria bacterium]
MTCLQMEINRMHARHLLIVLMALLLNSGCGVQDMFKGKDNTVPPAPLTEIQSQIQVNKLWSNNVGKGPDKQYVNLVPSISGQHIFTASRDGVVTAMDAKTGRQKWRTDTKARLAGGPGTGDGLVLVGSSDGEVIALSEADGKQVWKARVTSEVLSVPSAAAGVSVVRTTDGRLFGLSSETGNRLWNYDRTVPVLTLRGSSSPVLIGGLVICGFESGKISALSLKNGRPYWEKSVTFPTGRSELERIVDIDGDPLVINGIIYASSYQGRVVAIELETSKTLWARDLSSFTGMAADIDHLYVTDDNGYVWALDRRSGSSLWKQDKLFNRQVTAPVSIGDYVVVGDFEGYLHWLSKEDGHFVARTRADSAGINSNPIVSDDILYSYGQSGELTAMSIR